MRCHGASKCFPLIIHHKNNYSNKTTNKYFLFLHEAIIGAQLRFITYKVATNHIGVAIPQELPVYRNCFKSPKRLVEFECSKAIIEKKK